MPLAPQACLRGPLDLLRQATTTPIDLCLLQLPHTMIVGHMMDMMGVTRAATTTIATGATRAATMATMATRAVVRVVIRISLAAPTITPQAVTIHTVLRRATSRSVPKGLLHHSLGASRIIGHNLPESDGRVKIPTAHDRTMGVGLERVAAEAIVDVPTEKRPIDLC